MDKELWKIQKQLNELNKKQTDAMYQYLIQVIEILEEHEKDMVRMAEEINLLNKELSELKGLS